MFRIESKFELIRVMIVMSWRTVNCTFLNNCNSHNTPNTRKGFLAEVGVALDMSCKTCLLSMMPQTHKFRTRSFSRSGKTEKGANTGGPRADMDEKLTSGASGGYSARWPHCNVCARKERS